jgi:hypothetical protein
LGLGERSENTLLTPWKLRSKISGVTADMDRKVVICPCKKLRSRIEAIVEDSRDFID